MSVRRGDRNRTHRDPCINADPTTHLLGELAANKNQIVGDKNNLLIVMAQEQRGGLQLIVNARARARDMRIAK